MHLKGYADVAEPKITNCAKELLHDLLVDWKLYQNEWDTIIKIEMNTYNMLYKKLGCYR